MDVCVPLLFAGIEDIYICVLAVHDIVDYHVNEELEDGQGTPHTYGHFEIYFV